MIVLSNGCAKNENSHCFKTIKQFYEFSSIKYVCIELKKIKEHLNSIFAEYSQPFHS